MKNRMCRLALIALCILCTVALASCFKKKPAEEHEHVWDEGVITVQGDCETGKEGEIVYTCTICGEKKTEKTDGHAWDEGNLIAEPTCAKTGTMLYTCQKCKQTKRVELPTNDQHDFDVARRLVTPPTAASEGVDERVCKRCGASRTFPSETTYAAYKAQVASIKTKIGGFSNSDFGTGSVTTDLGSGYTTPTVKPTVGQHPRVMFNENDVAGIQNALTNGMNKAAAAEFRKEVALMETGVLPAAWAHGDNGTHNFSGQVLANIMSLALDYQLTKNEASGYQAILAAKNYLKTIDVQSFKPDPERTMGNIMYAMACVYDWCYDLLSATDKTQIVLGVQKKCCESAHLEIGFPPSGQGAVAGHGCEFQLLRDYLAFAIAIYDEYPGWWNYVGGRFYQDFVPVRNEFYRAGMVPQGVSQYVQIRFAADCYSALLIKAMTGSIPYDAAGMKQVMRTVYSHELPTGSFASGDGSTATKSLMDYGMAAMISSHLFNDATIRAQFERNKSSYSTFGDGQYGLEQTVGYAAEELICSSGEVKASADVHQGMDLVLYNGGWLGQMIARNNWTADQAAVLMKIGVRADSNHGHQDAGQFQIYYQGLLAGDTGVYASYGKDHWKKYHQATIAHNSLLINGSGQISHTEETGKLSGWANGSYDTGVVTGYASGYADAAKKTPTYGYIAGNIAKAYGSSVASEVTRRMLVVYDTGNADVPMFFFVFDNITANSGSYKKTFLLHTVSSPSIDAANKTVTVTGGNGKLVLQSVFGGDNFEAIGGTGKNYWVNGTQIESNREPYDDGFWGRVEISPNTGKATDQLLNVMYVCGKTKSPNLKATQISSNEVKGAVIGNTAAVFVIDQNRRSTGFTFTATGTGTLNYYVSGVKAGNWTVKVGSNTQTVNVTEAGGLLVFSAPAGTVTLTPQ